MLSAQVYDVIDATRARLRRGRAGRAPMPRARCRRWCASARRCARESTALKRFLFANLYRHPQVMQTTEQAQEVVRELFAAYLARPGGDARPASPRARDRHRARWPTTSPA